MMYNTNYTWRPMPGVGPVYTFLGGNIERAGSAPVVVVDASGPLPCIIAGARIQAERVQDEKTIKTPAIIVFEHWQAQEYDRKAIKTWLDGYIQTGRPQKICVIPKPGLDEEQKCPTFQYLDLAFKQLRIESYPIKSFAEVEAAIAILDDNQQLIENVEILPYADALDRQLEALASDANALAGLARGIEVLSSELLYSKGFSDYLIGYSEGLEKLYQAG